MKHKTLYKKLAAFAPKFYGEKTMGQIMYWVRKMLKPHGVKVNRIIDKTNTALSAFTVGGFYDPYHEFDEADIEMYLVFNECERDNAFFFDEETTDILINELFITLSHEKRHKYQFRKRGQNYGAKYKCKVTDENLKQQLEYYGDSDEIDSYAIEHVLELQLHKATEVTTRDKYRELFAKYDPKIYNKFLKKYYKFNQQIIL